MTNESSSSDPPIDPELLDLLIKRSVTGLDQGEADEFAALDAESLAEANRLEVTAAAFDLALTDADALEGMPPSLMEKLEAGAQGFFQGANARGDSAIDSALTHSEFDADEDEAVEPSPRRTSNEGQTGPPVSRRELISMVIAAASLLLVFTGLNPLAYNPNQTKSAEQRMASLVSSRPADLLEWDFKGVGQPNASGRVVWSDEKQEGYMVLTGMATNDPSVEQYQLWVFDTDPKQEYPVDGGVFDFSDSRANEKGEVIIPIDNKIRVAQAVQFAVTTEKSGGVVVSDRSRLPLLAPRPE